MQSADQQENDREANMLRKAALYDRMSSGQACSSSASADFLVDFEKNAQEQQPSAARPDLLASQPAGFEPVHFRQRGTLQVCYAWCTLILIGFAVQ